MSTSLSDIVRQFFQFVVDAPPPSVSQKLNYKKKSMTNIHLNSALFESWLSILVSPSQRHQSCLSYCTMKFEIVPRSTVSIKEVAESYMDGWSWIDFAFDTNKFSVPWYIHNQKRIQIAFLLERTKLKKIICLSVNCKSFQSC